MLSLVAPLLAPLIAIPDYSALASLPAPEPTVSIAAPAQGEGEQASAVGLCTLPSAAMEGVTRGTAAVSVAPMLAERPTQSAPALWIVPRSRPEAAGAPAPGFTRPQLSMAEPSRQLELWREADGLFYVTANINGQPVRFLVDTGASMIVLTAEDARRTGAAAQPGASEIRTETANGDRSMSRVTLASMQVGATSAAAVPAAVARDGLKVSLLGQNWLSHIRSVTIDGDRMVLQ